ncbi:MAG: cohesin domain-containing protein [Saprospiraceae bacterium]
MKQIFTLILFFSFHLLFGQLDCFVSATQISCSSDFIDANVENGTNVITGGYCGSTITGYTGFEKSYKFTLQQKATVYLKITDLTADLDLFLLRSCQVSDCIASSTQPATVNSEFIAVTLDPGTYYAIVDGWNGAVSKYNLSLSCTPNDGQVICTNAKPLECNRTVTDSTTLGLNNAVGPYCSNLSNYIGKEKVYSINVTSYSRIQATLKGFTQNEDLFLLSECDKLKCLASSTKTGLLQEDIGINLQPGKYYLVVDGLTSINTKYQLSLTCTPINNAATLDCNTAITVNYSGNGSDLKFNYVFSGASTHRFIQWRYNSTILSTQSNVNLLFQGAGTYNICADYEDLATGQIKSCCKQSCIALPNNCEDIIQYQYTNGYYTLSLAGNQSQYQNVTWRNDTDGLPLNPNYVPASCRIITATVSYYNSASGCWTLCCRTINLCPPLGCENDISFYYNSSSNAYQFSFSNPYATNIVWKFEDTNTTLPNGQFYVPSNWTCQERTVSVYYKDISTNCWRVCSKRVTICPPINCQNAISYVYNSIANKFVFTLANSYGTSQIWKFEETNTILPNGEFFVPSNWSCREVTVSVYYFDISSQCYRVCSKIVTICPPINCETAIQYTYVPSGNKYQFTLNVPGAQFPSWYFEEGGTSLPNGTFYLPSNWTCQEKTVVVHYYDSFSSCWRVCSRIITICPPVTCENAIDYTFNTVTNAYHFSLNIPGATSISWQFDDTHTSIPNGTFVIPANWTCQDRPVSVYYYYPGSNCWRVCCKWVSICPPTNCNDVIHYKYNPDGDAIVLSYSGSNVSQLTWTNETTGTQIGTVGSTQVVYSLTGLSCATHTFSIKYYENGSWKMCCKNIYVCNPNHCSNTITSQSNGNTLTVSVPSVYQDIEWINPNTNTVLGTGNTLQIPIVNGTYSGLIAVNYYDPANLHYKTCAKQLEASCPKPLPDFSFTINGDVVSFSNASLDATSYSWNFDGGLPVSGSSHIDANPTVSFSQGVFDVCLTATNACGNAQICKSITITQGHDCSFYIPEMTCGTVGTEIIIPIKVADFEDVITFNFTLRNNNPAAVYFKSIEQINPAIQSGYNHHIENDHLRFLWSSASGKTLDDESIIFYVRAQVVQESSTPVNVFFSNDPVKIEAFNASLQKLNVQTSAGNVCIDAIPEALVINGELLTYKNHTPITNTDVFITGDMQDSVITSNTGGYTLDGVTYNSSVNIYPYRDHDTYNGVNALDIVALQRHILSVQQLTSPYAIVAADVNRDNVINALDIVTLQKLQLRLIEQFPNNTSWRFIPKSYAFTTSNPLSEAFPEVISFDPITLNVNDLDFYGIKIGDLNDTNDGGLQINGDDPNTRATLDSLKLEASQIYTTPEGIINVPVKAESFEGLTSLEGSIHFDTNTLKFIGVKDFGLLGMGEDNFGRPTKYGSDVITFTWSNGTLNGVDISNNKVLFVLQFEVIGDVGKFAEIEFNNYPLAMLSSDKDLNEVHVYAPKTHVDILAPLASDAIVTSSTCYGENSGSIYSEISGGTGQYTYQWSNGSTEANITNLADGVYELSVTDKIAGLTFSSEYSIESPDKIEGTIEFNSDLNKISISATGGTAPYVFIWNTGEKFSEITVSENGLYSVVVVDSKLCVSQKYEILVTNFITSTSDDRNKNFVIYPNPASDKLYFNSETNISGESYTIFSMNGQAMQYGTFQNENYIVLPEVSDGMYVLHIPSLGKKIKLVIRK